jgi:predicted small metal-binding protein
MTMASISCRDVGRGCDKFVQGDDTAQVLLETIRHTMDEHADEFAKVSKTVPVWKVVAGGVLIMKDVKKEVSRAECKRMGLTCEWSTTTDTFPDAFVALIKHWEEGHPNEFAQLMTQSSVKMLGDMVGAIVIEKKAS